MEIKKEIRAGKTAPEREIEAGMATEGDARKTGITTSEQPLTETEVPEAAVLARGYYKWTDNDGEFRKVPIDGTTAIREPAHEQHELTVEDRDRLYEAAALKTPRRPVPGVNPEDIQKEEIHNDEVHSELVATATPVKAEAPKRGPVADNKPGLVDSTVEVKVGEPALDVTANSDADRLKR